MSDINDVPLDDRMPGVDYFGDDVQRRMRSRRFVPADLEDRLKELEARVAKLEDHPESRVALVQRVTAVEARTGQIEVRVGRAARMFAWLIDFLRQKGIIPPKKGKPDGPVSNGSGATGAAVQQPTAGKDGDEDAERARRGYRPRKPTPQADAGQAPRGGGDGQDQ